MNDNQVNDIVHAYFGDVPSPVVMINCAELLGILDVVFVTWPYQLLRAREPVTGRAIVIDWRDGVYYVSSPWMEDRVRKFQHSVDVACWLVVEFSWAFLEDNPELLCLHCASVEISGRLIVMPNQYKAGKSVLSACLAARGHRVFGDDILPVGVAKDGSITGMSTGVAPRLRLPLPTDLHVDDIKFLTSSLAEASNRYVYLRLSEKILAHRNEVLNIGSIILLERSDDEAVRLEPINKAEVLQAAIWQNFSRQLPSVTILNILRSLVEGTEHYRLHYSNAGEAADCLSSAFKTWRLPIPVVKPINNVPQPSSRAGRHTTIEEQDPVMARTVGVFEYQVEDDSFLASPLGASIFRLNLLASAVWRLLETPMRPSELLDIVCLAFPEEDGGRIRRDIMNLLTSLSIEHFIQVADQ